MFDLNRRLRRGGGVNFSNKAFKARLKLARVPVISAHPLRHAATPLLNERGANLRDVQALLGHKSIVGAPLG